MLCFAHTKCQGCHLRVKRRSSCSPHWQMTAQRFCKCCSSWRSTQDRAVNDLSRWMDLLHTINKVLSPSLITCTVQTLEDVCAGGWAVAPRGKSTPPLCRGIDNHMLVCDGVPWGLKASMCYNEAVISIKTFMHHFFYFPGSCVYVCGSVWCVCVCVCVPLR